MPLATSKPICNHELIRTQENSECTFNKLLKVNIITTWTLEADALLFEPRHKKTKFLHVSKISFNKRYLLHTYDCYTSIATPEKRNELTLGHLHGPWTELTLNSPSV